MKGVLQHGVRHGLSCQLRATMTQGTGEGTMKRDSLLRTAVLDVTIALATPTPASAQVPKRASPDKIDRTGSSFVRKEVWKP